MTTRIAAKIQGSILLIALVALAACNPEPIYEEYVEIPESGWYKDSLIRFTVTIEDTSKPYELAVNLRNNDQYEYSNIYLFRKITSERGVEFADTISYTLADEYGKWTGEGIGELKTNIWPFKNNSLLFRHKGNYTFTFQQAMREDYLQGVEDFGLSVYKIENPEK